MTDSLVEFLNARLDEDERAARDAQAAPTPRTPGGWPHETEILHGAKAMDVPDAVIGCYLAHGDPVRVLDEVDAKRRLMARIFKYEAKIDGEWGCSHEPNEIAAGQCSGAIPSELEALRLIALPYHGHPDYRGEWAPDAS